MNVFKIVPQGFFNLLSSQSNNEIYSECLQFIYNQYENEISYRIPRNELRDSLAAFLIDNHSELIGDFNMVNSLSEANSQTSVKSYGDLASAILRKFTSEDTGWLEEEEEQYNKYITMSESGIRLAEFLFSLSLPVREEYSSYIYDIYNRLENQRQWEQNPYTSCLKPVYKNAKDFSKSLKKLSTFIRKIIWDVTRKTTYEDIIENILTYCDGYFIREYERLIKQCNVRDVRKSISASLNQLFEDSDQFDLLVIDCAIEEECAEDEAGQRVMDMIERTKKFLYEDYDRIIEDIRKKMGLYLQLAINQIRFAQNISSGTQEYTEELLRTLISMKEIAMDEYLPNEIGVLFPLQSGEFLDLNSLYYTRQRRSVMKETVADYEELTEDDIKNEMDAIRKESYDPYSKELMKRYLDEKMGNKRVISSKEFKLESKSDLLISLAICVHSMPTEMEIEAEEDYRSENGMVIRNFTIRKL